MAAGRIRNWPDPCLSSVRLMFWLENSMAAFVTVYKSLKGFVVDRDGNFAIIGGLIMAMLAMAVGFGINIAQAYSVRAGLVSALDSALTSTGRDLSTGVIAEKDANASVLRFLQVNGDAGLTEANKIVLEPVKVDRVAKTVTATAYTDVNVFFPFFGQSDTIRVSTTGETLYSDTLVEVAMMLDLTGSMNERGSPLKGKYQSKIDNLKTAAELAVDNLTNRNAAGKTPRVRIALVPYSTGVDAGPLADYTWVERTAPVAVPGVGLVTLADQPMTTLDLAKTVNKPIQAALNIARQQMDDCTTERKTVQNGKLVMDMSDEGPDTGLVSRDKRLGKQSCPTSSLVPLTADKAKLDNAISGFQGGGYTAGQIGIQWTRYLLSPKWADPIRAVDKNAVPAAYSLPNQSVKKVKKIAILMTDGEFNTAYAGVTGNVNQQDQRSSGYALNLCSQMKAQGIEVFTVGFMAPSAAKTMLSDCASEPTASTAQHFYDATSGEELSAAFDEITRNVEKLALIN